MTDTNTRLQPNAISFSSIQRYGYIYKNKTYGCPFSYFLRKGTDIQPSKIDDRYRVFGQIIHLVLEKFYDTAIIGCISNYTTPKDYFYLVLENLLNQQWDYTLSETQYKDAISIIKQFAESEAKRYDNYKAGKIKSFTPQYKELSLYEPFNIRIDKILHDHTFIDYKTTKEDYMPKILTPQSIDDIAPQYILQAGTYALSYYAKYQIWSPRMIYHFVRCDKPMLVQITQQIIDITSRIANTVIENINARKFNKNSENCEWCDYRHVCGLEEVDVVF